MDRSATGRPAWMSAAAWWRCACGHRGRAAGGRKARYDTTTGGLTAPAQWLAGHAVMIGHQQMTTVSGTSFGSPLDPVLYPPDGRTRTEVELAAGVAELREPASSLRP